MGRKLQDMFEGPCQPKRPLPSTTFSLPRPAPFPSPDWLQSTLSQTFPVCIPLNSNPVSLPRSTPMKMELPVSSETSTLKAQTPGDYPKGIIRHSTHGWCLKSRLNSISTTCFGHSCGYPQGGRYKGWIYLYITKACEPVLSIEKSQCLIPVHWLHKLP